MKCCCKITVWTVKVKSCKINTERGENIHPGFDCSTLLRMIYSGLKKYTHPRSNARFCDMKMKWNQAILSIINSIYKTPPYLEWGMVVAASRSVFFLNSWAVTGALFKVEGIIKSFKYQSVLAQQREEKKSQGKPARTTELYFGFIRATINLA